MKPIESDLFVGGFAAGFQGDFELHRADFLAFPFAQLADDLELGGRQTAPSTVRLPRSCQDFENVLDSLSLAVTVGRSVGPIVSQ